MPKTTASRFARMYVDLDKLAKDLGFPEGVSIDGITMKEANKAIFLLRGDEFPEMNKVVVIPRVELTVGKFTTMPCARGHEPVLPSARKGIDRVS